MIFKKRNSILNLFLEKLLYISKKILLIKIFIFKKLNLIKLIVFIKLNNK